MLVERRTTEHGDTLLYQGRYLYSTRNPCQRAQRALPNLIAENTLYVIVSPLLCYGIADFLAKLPVTSAVLLLEVEPNLSVFTQAHCPAQTKHLKVSLGEFNPYELEVWLKSLEFFDLQHLSFSYPSMAHQCDVAGHARARELITRLFEQYQHNNRMLKVMRKRWLRNVIAQLGMPLASYASIERVDRPVVVIGAGLTLEYAAAWLKKVQHLYYLVAVDTALPSLLAYDIAPDVVMVLEASAINILDFMASGHLKQTTFLVDLSAHPQTLRLFKGRALSIMSDFSHAHLFQTIQNELKIKRYNAAGSVGITAVMIALQLTQEPVILCGLDFAYPLGRSHAKAAYSHSLQLQEWRRLCGVPKVQEALQRALVRVFGQHGEVLNSDKILAGYAQAITQSQIPRLYSLESPHAIDMQLPIWPMFKIDEQYLAEKRPLRWVYRYYGEQQRAVIEWEIMKLQHFLAGDESGIEQLNYLHMGQNYALMQQFSQVQLLAKEALVWWQRSRDGWSG